MKRLDRLVLSFGAPHTTETGTFRFLDALSPNRKLPSPRDLSGGSCGSHLLLPRQGFLVLLRSHLVRGEEPCPDRSVSDPQVRGYLTQALALSFRFQNPFKVYPALLAAQLLAIRSRI